MREPSRDGIDFETTNASSDVLQEHIGLQVRQLLDDALGDGCEEGAAAACGVEHGTTAPVDSGGRSLVEKASC